MIKSIAIEITNRAFLPESYAYRDYFLECGFCCDFVQKGVDDTSNYDAIILFHGFHPFWHKYPDFIIGEYHSLSTGRFSRSRDFIKRLFNVKPNLYIFLNEDVRIKMWFSNRINYITRNMGYNEIDLQKIETEKKIYDIVYCGSYRDGLWPAVKKLADLGMKVAIVGPELPFVHTNVTNFGRKALKKAQEIIIQARIGLNYTPDVFPFNIQDSTKVIEYSAANLGIITNRYKWINDFESSRNGGFLDLERINTKEDILNFNFIVPNVEDLKWSDIMKRSDIKAKII